MIPAASRPAPSAHRDADAPHLLALVLAGGSAMARRRLLELHGSAERAIAAAMSAPPRPGLLDAGQHALLARPDSVALARGLEWLARPGHRLIGWHSPDYPPLLRHAPNPPLALFVDGDPAALWKPAVAVVGSRAPSAGGRDNAHGFARALARAGLAVTSGLAAGIDAAAHEAALSVADAATVAVLGTGPDVAYPRRHAALRDRIAASGGAVASEHPPGTPPQRSHFPSRNRIIAGLALGTLVVEAAERSGALITARLAGEAGREVFAVPGSIHNPMARGCHRLIRDGAQLVESADEVIEALLPAVSHLAETLSGGLPAAPASPSIAPPSAPAPDSSAPLEPGHQMLWDALGFDPMPMDRLVERTGLTAAALSSMLLLMELDGKVAVQHGRYVRRAATG